METKKKQEILYNRFHGDFWKHSNRTWIFFAFLIGLFIGIKPWELGYIPFYIKSIAITGVGIFLIYSSYKEIAFARDCKKLRDRIIRNRLDTLVGAEHKKFREGSRFDTQIIIMVIIIISSSLIRPLLNVFETRPLQWSILWFIPSFFSISLSILSRRICHKRIRSDTERN